MAHIFLSYSRKDTEFVHQLHDALGSRDHSAWVDWEGIPPSAEWLMEVYAAIDSVDAFVFVISPDSVVSKVCGEELAHAANQHKRLIPVVRRDVDASLVPDVLRKLNYVFFQAQDIFESSLEKLIRAIDTDLEWVHGHTRVLRQATDWESHGRDASFLLRGMDLQDAVQWLAGAGLGKDPAPTDLHSAYINASRIHEAEEVQRLQDLYERALARQIAAQAELMRNQQAALLPRSVLLAVEAMRRLPTPEAYHAVLSGVVLLPLPVSSHAGLRAPIAISPAGDYIAAAVADANHAGVRLLDPWTGQTISEWPYEGVVTVLALSPDGRYVAAATKYFASQSGTPEIKARTARVWDTRARREVAALTHLHIIEAMAFSPDCRYLATGSTDKTGRLWRVSDWAEAGRFTHEYGVDALAFSPDGRWLATASHTGARIWDIERGEALISVNHLAAVQGLVFSPDARYLATASVDRTAAVWAVDDGQEVARLPIGAAQEAMAFEEGVTSVAFNRDGSLLATSSWDRTARVWEVATRREALRVTHEDGVSAVLFTPDDRHIVTSSADHTARVWDRASGREVIRISHNGRVEGLALSRDGRLLAGVGDSGPAMVHDIRATGALLELRHREFVDDVSFNAAGDRIATTSWYEGVRIWRADRDEEPIRLVDESPASSVAFSPSGSQVATAADRIISIRDVGSWHINRRLTHDERMREVTFSPDGRCIAGVGSRVIQIWDLTGEAPMLRLPHGADVVRTCFSPDGRYFATTARDNSARLWDVSTGGEVHRLICDCHIRCAFSPDGKFLATTNSFMKSTAQITDVDARREVLERPHNENIAALAFSPNNEYLATAGIRRDARLWKLPAGEEAVRFSHDGDINCIAFSPDGRYVVTGSNDHTARVWEVPSAREVAILPHPDSVYRVVFNPNSELLATASWDRVVRVWRWRPEDLLTEACARVRRNLTPEEWRRHLGDLPYRKTCPDCP